MTKMYELTGADLDAVGAGAGAGAAAGGLVALAVAAAADLSNISVLDNNHVSILDNSLNGNKTNVGAGVLINLLGGPSAFIGHVG